MIAFPFIFFYQYSLSLSFIILHPYEIIDFITISKVLNLGGNTGKNYDGIKIKNGRTRKWAGSFSRRSRRNTVAKFGRLSENQSYVCPPF